MWSIFNLPRFESPVQSSTNSLASCPVTAAILDGTPHIISISMVPNKPGQKPEDHASDIEIAPEDYEIPMLEKLDKIESVPIFRCTPDQHMDDVDDIVTWLQNGKDDSDDSKRLGLDEE